MEYNFQKKHNFNARLHEAKEIKIKYKNRIPVIIEKDKNAHELPNIDKSKYLVPTDITLGQFMVIIRKKLNLNQNQTIFFFIENTIQPTSHSMGNIYNNFANIDGFLYMKYTAENTFG